ncbi:MAG: bacterial Ig-like domain-containing protein [Clostridia bacterium]|nr:bacterial Ig-like domain-containing protein [Clostridia bacterium]
MKKRFNIIYILTLLVCFACVFAMVACNTGGGGNGEDTSLSSASGHVEGTVLSEITVKSLPDKTVYVVGEELDLTGAFITALFSDGGKEDVSITPDMVSGYDGATAGVKNLTVTYSSAGITKTTNFNVSVKGIMDVRHGRFIKTNNSYESAESNSIALITNGKFTEGTYSAAVFLMASGDNGIIFGVSAGEGNFWEEEGVSYYFFFITRDGGAYLGKVDDGTWSALNYTPIAGFDFSVTHKLSVCMKKSGGYTLISCFVDDEKYAVYRDYDDNIGSGYGMRAGNSGVVYFEPTVTDSYIDDETVYTDIENVRISSGNFTGDETTLVSSTERSIAVFTDKQMAYGEYSATIRKNGTGDDGIIFAISENGNTSYWENGVSYYFYFVSLGGTAYLGKANNGAWTVCATKSIPNYTENGSFTLKVARTSIGITCYVDDELYFNYNDASPLTGTGVGVRAAIAGVEWTNVSVTETGEFEYVEPTGFTVTSGKFTQFEEIIASVEDKSLMIYDEALSNGTVIAKVTPGSDTNNGIVFRLTAPESDDYYEKVEGLSYYFFHVSTTKTARLLRFEGTRTKICGQVGLSAGYTSGEESELMVIMNGSNVKCYLNGALYVDFTDETPLSGDKIGIRASASGVLTREFSVSDNVEPIKADVVVFGHSHAECWTYCESELSSLGTVANLGVGGTCASHWLDRAGHIAAYDPKYVIVWLGSNDLGANIAEDTIVNNMKTILSGIRSLVPDAEIIVLTEFYQPGGGRDNENFHTRVRSLNDRYKQEFSSLYTVCDIFDTVLDDDGNLITSLFKDVYHLKPGEYMRITQRILETIDENG